MKLTYTGGSAAIEIRLPDRWLHVTRGETVEVTEDEADRLIIMEGWHPAPVRSNKKDTPS